VTPTLEELLETVIAAVMRRLRVGEPAEVLSYDAATQKAIVQPYIHRGRYDEDGIRQTARPAAISDVPVAFPTTADGWRQTYPIAPGDTVLIAYADRSLDRWLVRGGEIDPADDRAHAPSDAIIIGTMRDFAHAIATVGTKPAIGYPGALVEFTSAQIQAGGTSPLALHAKLEILWNHVNVMPTGTLVATPIVGSLGSGTDKLRGA
jgi:hypothetical protein